MLDCKKLVSLDLGIGEYDNLDEAWLGFQLASNAKETHEIKDTCLFKWMQLFSTSFVSHRDILSEVQRFQQSLMREEYVSSEELMDSQFFATLQLNNIITKYILAQVPQKAELEAKAYLLLSYQ